MLSIWPFPLIDFSLILSSSWSRTKTSPLFSDLAPCAAHTYLHWLNKILNYNPEEVVDISMTLLLIKIKEAKQLVLLSVLI